MSLSFPVRAACDRCGAEMTFGATIAKLSPVTVYLSPPPGWACSTKPDSGELRVTCQGCAGHESLLPTAPAPKFGEEPLTNPAKSLRTVK